MQDFKGSRDYVASDELMRSVNIAVALEKPLLIRASREPARRSSRRRSRTAWGRN